MENMFHGDGITSYRQWPYTPGVGVCMCGGGGVGEATVDPYSTRSPGPEVWDHSLMGPRTGSQGQLNPAISYHYLPPPSPHHTPPSLNHLDSFALGKDALVVLYAV